MFITPVYKEYQTNNSSNRINESPRVAWLSLSGLGQEGTDDPGHGVTKAGGRFWSSYRIILLPGR